MPFNQADWESQILQLEKRILVGLSSGLAELVSKTVAELNRLSSAPTIEPARVRAVTGAYRSSHHVTLKNGRVLYVSPDKPPGDERIDRNTRGLAKPSPAKVRQAIRQWWKGIPDAADEIIEIRNDRYYATFLEYGTARMAPRAIYAQAQSFALSQEGVVSATAEKAFTFGEPSVSQDMAEGVGE